MCTPPTLLTGMADFTYLPATVVAVYLQIMQHVIGADSTGAAGNLPWYLWRNQGRQHILPGTFWDLMPDWCN